MENNVVDKNLMFDGTRFKVWERRMKLKLAGMAIQGALVAGGVETSVQKAKALETLVNHCVDGDTAPEFLENLRKRYDKTGCVEKSGTEYCDEIRKLTKQIGEDEMEEETWILNSMPPSMDSIRAAAKAMIVANNVSGIRDLVCATYKPPNPSNNGPRGTAFVAISIKRFRCNRTGHFSKTCFTGLGGSNSQRSNVADWRSRSGASELSDVGDKGANLNWRNRDNDGRANSSPTNPLNKCYRCGDAGYFGITCPKYGDHVGSMSNGRHIKQPP